jgi:hypothetical protein
MNILFLAYMYCCPSHFRDFLKLMDFCQEMKIGQGHTLNYASRDC